MNILTNSRKKLMMMLKSFEQIPFNVTKALFDKLL